MHKPKHVRDHYTESLSVNSENLKRQLAEAGVQEGEISAILQSIAGAYMQEVENIVTECEGDMMALEKVPSPLKLFVDSIAEAKAQSPQAMALLGRYVSAWEDWM
ncbi:MAG: hypothetical protein ACREAY_05960 [Nitrososphaera sp.]|uniref:hypothetical protein n=1 Tax=Nitrososphaera sp. TaxID=1971748 RepID=UPI003D6F8D6A